MNLDEQIGRVTETMLTAEHAYQRAKARYEAITRVYTDRPGVDRALAELKAAGDYRRQEAVADCGFYRAEFAAYAAMLAALLGLADTGAGTTHDLHPKSPIPHDGWAAGRAAQTNIQGRQS